MNIHYCSFQSELFIFSYLIEYDKVDVVIGAMMFVISSANEPYMYGIMDLSIYLIFV